MIYRMTMKGEKQNYSHMNADKETTIKNSTCLFNSQKIIPHKIKRPGKLWKVVGPDMFTINSSNFLCIVNYYGKFAIVKQVEKLV